MDMHPEGGATSNKESLTMSLAERRADVTWKGDLMSGSGVLTFASSGLATETPVTWASRTESADGRTSPEELLAAALASCFAMAFSNGLAKGGNPPEELQVSANAHLDRKPEGGVKVSLIELSIKGKVPGLSADAFKAAADAQACPITGVLDGNVEIRKTAELLG